MLPTVNVIDTCLTHQGNHNALLIRVVAPLSNTLSSQYYYSQ